RAVLAERERAPDPPDLVGGNRLTVAAAAQHDACAARVRGDTGRGEQHERRVVVLGVVREWSAVDRLVTEPFDGLHESALQLVTGMVRPQVDAHGQAVSRTCA